MDIVIDSAKVDWKLLRSQKADLVMMLINKDRDMSTFKGLQGKMDTFEGLLGFIDYVQDQAAYTMGEKEIFGSSEISD